MNKELKVLNDILKEAKKTNRLLNEMNETVSIIMKKLIPGKQTAETIQRGGPVAEITVYTPEKLEEWKAIFESKGLKVEFYEPYTFDENYFAKLWGYLEKPERQKERKK